MFGCLLLAWLSLPQLRAAPSAFGRRQGLRGKLVDAAVDAAAVGTAATTAGRQAWTVATALAVHKQHKLRVTQMERTGTAPRIRPVYVGDNDAACAALPKRKLLPAEVLRGCHWDYDQITTPRDTCSADSPTGRQAALKAAGRGAPNERPFKAAMVYLCIPVEACHFEYLALSIMSWHHFWNRYFNYPVVIFSKAQDADSIRHEVAPLVAAGVHVQIETVAEKWLVDPNIACPDWRHKSDEPCSRRFTESYRNMNRFFTKDMYWQPAFDDIDFFLRIDTDSFLVQIWCDDPFARMHTEGKHFLYNGISVTNPNCHKGIRDAVSEFTSTTGVVPVSDLTNFVRPDGDGDRPDYGYSGCVGAGSKRFFRHHNYTAFTDFMRKKCGIYYHRWSEQVFFYYSTAIYGTREQVGKINSPHIHGRDKGLWMTCLRERLMAAGYGFLRGTSGTAADLTGHGAAPVVEAAVAMRQRNDVPRAQSKWVKRIKPACEAREAPVKPLRLLFTTVPRSASTFTRRLLEYSTGIASESVWREGGEWSDETKSFGSCMPIGVFKGSDGKREAATGSGCPVNLRRATSADPLVVKSHFPVQHREWQYMKAHRISAILKTIRNPLDEYDSWRRWRGKNPEWPRFLMSFKEFAGEWVKFHTHWDAWSKENCTPIVEFKFEDLMKEKAGVLREVLQQTGLWDELSLSNASVAEALRIVVEQDEKAHAAHGKVTGSLKTGMSIGKQYLGKEFGDDVSVADIDWFATEHGNLLKRYGYNRLFETARKELAAAGPETSASTTAKKKLIVLSAPNAWLLQPTLSCPLEDCANCEFSMDKSRMPEADVVIFFARSIRSNNGVGEPIPAPRRPPGQIWVFFTTESRRHFGEVPADYANAFNLTMTYKLNSDVPMTYLDRQWFRLLPFQDSELGAVHDESMMFLVAPKNRGKLNCDYVLNKDLCEKTISGAYLNTGAQCSALMTNAEYRALKFRVLREFTTAFPEKTSDAPIMFMASNPTKCHQNCDKNNRMAYVKALMEHTKVDSYGLVLHNKDEVSIGSESYTMSGRKHGNWERPVVIKILSAYKFYLAFENSNCDDYLTEKFFRPLLAGNNPKRPFAARSCPLA